MVDLSIIIISYNTKKLTIDCVNSVVKNTKGMSYEIIIVDNGSNDGSPEAVKKLKNVKLIQNKKNFGFAAANNQGTKIAVGKYILYLNSDTLILDEVLNEMVNWMAKNPRVGVSTCTLKNKYGSIQATGGYFPNIFRIFAWMIFLDDLPILGRLIKSFHPHTPGYFLNNPDYLKKHEQDWVTGAFLLTRKDVIDSVGGWDEDYFMYMEEVDLCFKIKNRGWKIWFLPRWSIIHYGGASAPHEFSILSEYKGIKIFYKKHYPSWQFPILRLLLKVGALGRIVLFGKTYAKAFRIA